MAMLTFTPPLIAHRGASQYAPENTLAAFRQAKELGASWVEFDVMLSADEEVVVIHDETLDRTTNLKGLVESHTVSALKKGDAGSWFNKAFRDERIPTLIEVIQLLNELKLFANIEIKAQHKEVQTVAKVLNIVNNYWRLEQPPLISSFSLCILQQVRQQSSSSALGYLMDEWQSDWNDICDNLQANAVDVNYKILTRERIREIKSSGRSLLAYTVNDAAIAQELIAEGVDAVFTDDLNEMRNFFQLTR